MTVLLSRCGVVGVGRVLDGYGVDVVVVVDVVVMVPDRADIRSRYTVQYCDARRYLFCA